MADAKISVEIRDERFRQIINEDTVIDQVATGFIFTEGAMWNSKTSELIFSLSLIHI